MGVPLSRVLHDFGAKREAAPAPARPAGSADVVPCEPVEDLSAVRMDEAYTRGEEAGRAAAAAEHARALADLHAGAEEQLAAERERWAAEQSDRLAAGLATALEALEARIGQSVARALTPFISTALRDRMIEALAESVGSLASSGRHARLQISGPADLLDGLKREIDGLQLPVEWEPSGHAEVRMIADDTLIETEFQSWIERFARAAR